MEKSLFTSESVTEGHPDKICDQLSDAILDEALRQDPQSRVAVECAVKNGGAMVFGEMSTKAKFDTAEIVRHLLKKIGYKDPRYGPDYEPSLWTQISQQSADIAEGIQATAEKEQGAGDQGMMFGFACDETPELMPLPIVLAHKLALQLSRVRKDGALPWMRPDGKTQATIEYDESGSPKRADTLLISTQHDDGVDLNQIREQVFDMVVRPVCGDWIDSGTTIHVNPAGKFVKGGPYADSGLTGRKIIVDTYGGMGRHGGGCFSGKDPSKVDRSGAYAARYIAKNIVAAQLAKRCEVQLAYAIGVAEPVSIAVDCFRTERLPEADLIDLIRKKFPLKPADIIEHLDLKRPLYLNTSVYGHFGGIHHEFSWEKTDLLSAYN